jgi:molybdopterin-containing oxidoreductase family iron-sulfur binding subunit
LNRETYRSIEELADSAEFRQRLEQAFPGRAGSWFAPVNRRRFLQVMGAALAMAGVSGCVRPPQEHLIPHAGPAVGFTPTEQQLYATTMTLGGYARGLLMRSVTGRPIKVEGNPQHPNSLGRTDVFAQASVLDLYDPERSQLIVQGGQASSWEKFLAVLQPALAAQSGSHGAGLRILTETVTSPSQGDLLRRLLARYPNARWHQYDPTHEDHRLAGMQQAFGRPLAMQLHLDRADVIVSLDCDAFMDPAQGIRNAWDWAQRRRVRAGGNPHPRPDMNRMYAIEVAPSLMGVKADHHLALRPSDIETFGAALASALGVGAGPNLSDERAQHIVTAAAGDLRAHGGRSIVLVGESLSPQMHHLGHLMNARLSNAGQTITYTEPVEVLPEDHVASLQALVADMQAGRVQMLVVLGGNPVYTAPADVPFAAALSQVPLSIHCGLYMDETASRCNWHLPESHYLESWGDARAFDGTVSLVQPLISPLYQSYSHLEILAALVGEAATSAFDIVRGYWTKHGGGEGWTEALRNGVVANTALPAVNVTPAASNVQPTAVAPSGSPAGANARPSASPTAASSAAPPELPSPMVPSPPPRDRHTLPVPTQPHQTEHGISGGQGLQGGEGTIPPQPVVQPTGAIPPPWPEQRFPDRIQSTPAQMPDGQPTLQHQAPVHPGAAASPPLELVFRPDYSVWDGRFANNSWLQECPRPHTRSTWDNAVLISPRTALALKLQTGNVVQLQLNGHEVAGPIWVNPGQADNTVLIELGYGRDMAGVVGNGAGFNAYRVRLAASQWVANGVTLVPTANDYQFATVQRHQPMEGRDLLRVGAIARYIQDPTFAQFPVDQPEHSLYPKWNYTGYAWAMAIDLTTCIGCHACVVACQSENNSPSVGREEVLREREMHWIRVDRRYAGDPTDPDIHFQPVPCMHCENAPCELVCPVGATVHSAEGLNEMVYNRCIGTRYCSNNCPYKVRRFNFFNYNNHTFTPSLELLSNPDVTVRPRGVMEKCSYCVQRIEAARIHAEEQDRLIRDGEVVPACAQACPTDTIVFGDLNTEGSRIRQMRDEPANYFLLGELNTRPRTTYLAELKNPNPALEPPHA